MNQLILNDGKKTFTRHEDVDRFVDMQRERNVHKSHSLCLLIFNSTADMVCSTLPGSAVSNGADHVQVPPQLRLTQEKILKVFPFWDVRSKITVYEVARVIAREILNMNIRNNPQSLYCSGHEAMCRNQLLYLGSTLGNGHHSSRPIPYGKHCHWVGVRLDRNKDAFRNDSVVYQEPKWFSPSHLFSLDKALAMSARKCEMIGDAALAYSRITGEHNKIARAVVSMRKQAA